MRSESDYVFLQWFSIYTGTTAHVFPGRCKIVGHLGWKNQATARKVFTYHCEWYSTDN